MTVLPRLHPSSLVDWQGCGKRFELSTLRREPPAFRHPAAINGTAIHSAIEWIHRDGWDASREALAEVYASAFSHAAANPVREEEASVPVRWGDYADERGARAALAADALDMIDGYRRDSRNRYAEFVLTEARWRATFGGFDWEGTLDQARKMTGGGIELVDLKSGSARELPTGAALAMWPQGFTYAIALKHAVFRPVDAAPHAPWEPMSLDARRVTWLQLRDYIPYRRGGKKGGVAYKVGDRRGNAFYSVRVDPASLDSHAREIHLFASAVEAGRFERRPSVYQCARCKVSGACLMEFNNSLDASALVASASGDQGEYDGQ